MNRKEMPHKEYSKLLINLSNHPSTDWPQEQILAAKVFGEVIDMAFPLISPLASEEDIENLALKYATRIQEHQKDHHVTVHLMGEMTFTFALISHLKSYGITCIASCTERVVEERDGRKVSEFHFRKFRRY